MKTMKSPVQNGQRVRHKLTGFVGVIDGIAFYLSECVRCRVVPSCDKDGKLVSAEWLDADQLELVTDADEQATVKTIGGPRDDPQNREIS